MYGFKGTDKDMKCRDFQYTLNKEFIYEGKIEACHSGFHLCKELKDVFWYYPIVEGSRYFIVKYEGKFIDDKYDDKIVSDTIILLEEITPEFILNEENINKYDFLSKNIDALLVLVSGKGGLEVFKHLLSLGANINCFNDYPLRMCSVNGKLDILKCLISLGVDITIIDNFALRYASEFGHLEVVKYIHSLGIDITVYDNYAIEWASRNGYLEVVKFLYSVGANITDRIYDLVCKSAHLEVIKFFNSVRVKSNTNI